MVKSYLDRWKQLADVSPLIGKASYFQMREAAAFIIFTLLIVQLIKKWRPGEEASPELLKLWMCRHCGSTYNWMPFEAKYLPVSFNSPVDSLLDLCGLTWPRRIKAWKWNKYWFSKNSFLGVQNSNIMKRVCTGHLEHQSTHAENHAQQVHVIRRRVFQSGIGFCAGWFVPETRR